MPLSTSTQLHPFCPSDLYSSALFVLPEVKEFRALVKFLRFKWAKGNKGFFTFSRTLVFPRSAAGWSVAKAKSAEYKTFLDLYRLGSGQRLSDSSCKARAKGAMDFLVQK